MSHIFTNQIRKLKVGNPTAKSVLLRLADYANDNGECFPSITLIADETEFSVRAIKTAINLLEEVKILQVDRSDGRHNRYKITPENFVSKVKKQSKSCGKKSTNQCNTFTSAGDAPVHEVHVTSAGDAPEPVHEVHTNHYITINNHHSSVVTHEQKNSDSVFEQPQPEILFVPVARKFMIPYFSHDSKPQTFHELENKYQVESDFQAQAHASFPELSSDSIGLIFNEYKRFWLTNQGFKQNPEKWMAHWITRVEKQKYSFLEKQQRQQKQNHPQNHSNYGQAKQDNINRWKNYGKSTKNPVIDVNPDFLVQELTEVRHA